MVQVFKYSDKNIVYTNSRYFLWDKYQIVWGKNKLHWQFLIFRYTSWLIDLTNLQTISNWGRNNDRKNNVATIIMLSYLNLN